MVRTQSLVLILILLAGCASTVTRPLPPGPPGVRGIASLEKIRLGGVDQWILIRGVDDTKPLLLNVHGGPGQAEMASVGYNTLLEQDFVVVEWDQRGAGKSAAAVDPISAMTLGQIVNDTVDLSRYLLARFHRNKLILSGHSWGSVVGIEAVQRAPELFSAFVSTGQIVDPALALGETYTYLTEEALRRNNADARRELADIGPPPYLSPDKPAKIQVLGRWIDGLGAWWHSQEPFDRTGMMLSAPEYSWPEKLAFLPAAGRSFELLGPDLDRVNLRTQVPKVSVPVFIAAGRFDRLAPTDVTRTWFDALEAPLKDWRWFENSAHFPMFEEPGPYHAFLLEISAQVDRLPSRR